MPGAPILPGMSPGSLQTSLTATLPLHPPSTTGLSMISSDVPVTTSNSNTLATTGSSNVPAMNGNSNAMTKNSTTLATSNPRKTRGRGRGHASTRNKSKSLNAEASVNLPRKTRGRGHASTLVTNPDDLKRQGPSSEVASNPVPAKKRKVYVNFVRFLGFVSNIFTFSARIDGIIWMMMRTL
jgi:hypothetical protein